MIPNDRLIREAQERAHRANQLATRLNHLMEQLARYRKQIDTEPSQREDACRKANWIMSELPGKMEEFEEASNRLEQAMNKLDSRCSTSPPSGTRKTFKTPTQPYFPRVEIPTKKVV